MGYLDDLAGRSKKRSAGAAGSIRPGERSSWIAVRWRGGRRTPGLIQSFKDKGLGDLTSSWIGTARTFPSARSS